jgi:hypothetical protein
MNASLSAVMTGMAEPTWEIAEKSGSGMPPGAAWSGPGLGEVTGVSIHPRPHAGQVGTVLARDVPQKMQRPV